MSSSSLALLAKQSLVVLEQLHDLIHEVVFVWILLVLNSHVEGLLEDLDNVRSVRGAHKVKRHLQIFHKLVLSLRSSLVNIDLIGNNNARNMRAVVPHLFVPMLQILISDAPIRVKDEDSNMGAEEVRGMQLIEGFLPSRVPHVNLELLSVDDGVVTVHCERMR